MCDPLGTYPSPTRVILPNLVALGETIGASVGVPQNLVGAGPPPIKMKGVSDPLEARPSLTSDITATLIILGQTVGV